MKLQKKTLWNCKDSVHGRPISGTSVSFDLLHTSHGSHRHVPCPKQLRSHRFFKKHRVVAIWPNILQHMWVLSITLGAGGFRREATVNNMAIYRSTPGQMVIPFQQHASEVFPSVCPSLHRPVLGGIALPVPLALAHALCGWVVVWCWCRLALLGSIGYPCNSSSKAKKLQDWRLMNCCKASLLNLRIFFWMIGDVWKSSIWYMGLYGVCFVQSAAVLLVLNWIKSGWLLQKSTLWPNTNHHLHQQDGHCQNMSTYINVYMHV